MTRKTIAKALREQGFTHRQIAEALDVSRQRAAQMCGKQDSAYFQPVGDNCPYKNLREWMNKNKVSRSEFLRRMGMTTDSNNVARFSNVLRGEHQPRKDYIERMLLVTGMTFEELFATE